ncbi:MAG: hypothetical protein WC794_04720 [Candidatus Doudnabacteria bacterium]|jgi:hypothetical protein
MTESYTKGWQEFYSKENKESRQKQRVLDIKNLAKEDAAKYLSKHLNDLGTKSILPSMNPDLPWGVDSPWEIEFSLGVEGRIAAKLGAIKNYDHEIYLREFEKECQLGYPQVKQ